MKVAWLYLVLIFSTDLFGQITKQYTGPVLVFSPHPDDDVLGCAGTIMQLVNAGNKVTIVYMTSGDAEAFNGTPQELAAIREQEARNAAQKMGVQDLIFLKQPDGKLSRVEKNAAKLVRDLLYSHKPSLVFVPHKYDGHKDHQATYNIVMQAGRSLKKADEDIHLPMVLCYEVWTPLTDITHKVNITKMIEQKIEALREHKSQISIRDYDDAIVALNRYRGIMSFVGTYAECFNKVSF